jgi:hypothetical protein
VPHNLAKISGIKLFPNPVGNKFTIIIESPYNEKSIFEIFDLLGKNLKRDEFYLTKGINSFSLDISDFNPGAYYFLSRSENTIRSIKFVKK